jgi:peptide chain release factor 1
MNIREQLEQSLKRFEELETQMADPEVLSNSNKMAAVAREHGSLTKVANKYKLYKKLSDEIKGLAEMSESKDPEESEMADAELEDIRHQREKLWNELLESTIGGEDANRSRCVMEIRAGTGGDEAALFAGDLFEMYKYHADAKGWKVEVMEASQSDVGGFKQVTLAFEGEGVFRELQFESGGHRVQRVPTTETQGRIHTSAATVAVMPEPEDVEIDLKPDDYRKDTYGASGPGGQHVNKTDSAVRLTHFESGIVVSCQDEKSQHKNLAQALRVLKSKLYDMKRGEELKKRADERKTLIGTGDRNARIRTYNFPQNRFTDHRIGLTLYKLDQIIAGSLQPVTDAILEHERDALRGDVDE